MLQRSEQPASQLFNAFTPSPQKLENLPGLDPALLQDNAVKADLAKIEQDLADAGRILVRPSGTEALIRVMVEADDEATLDAIMQEIILLVEAESKKLQ